MPLILASNLSGYTGLLKALGGDEASVLHFAKLDAQLLENIDYSSYISTALLETLLAAAAKATRHEHFAALLGVRQHIEFLGVLTPPIAQASSVRSALEKLIEMISLHLPGGFEIRLRRNAQTTEISSRANAYLGKHSPELSMAQLLLVCRHLINKHWLPVSVAFAHPAPQNIANYRAIFGDQLTFGQTKNACTFNNTDLDRPIAKIETNLLAIRQQHSKKLSHNADELQAHVERLICIHLPKGSCTIDCIADEMAMHRRTLHRKLHAGNTTFTKMLDAVRKNYAAQQLATGHNNTTLLASELGYADHTAFLRAFKRWYQTTPNKWQAQQRARLHTKAGQNHQ